ncbi:BCCT family transporter [Halalkalibacter akibai]|uniref:High-affinity choline uptake protein BetT n=1 Tax=Halalkalibacter akibai (strain ATCC 43226 / DSM 21942 / CIP 109018 / JCM 9157 / 1139) TaxID=1236973 RepID=W4QRV4_HALA3|nr:BCCT family transporter [Halalkalibacter akibai]GAE34049.1 high-affinity choline uptake protein BetT [Halalkalibacter akibai JCM 9157]
MDTIKNLKTDWTTFAVSGGFLLLFVIFSLIDINMVEGWVTDSFNWSVTFFGAYWQLLLLGNFVIGIILAFSKYGNLKLGKMEKPENGYFRWISMILCILLASGGVFWAASEPIYHFVTTPPLFANDGMTPQEAIIPALTQSFVHWGFLAWACLGTLTTIVLMYAHYHKGYPLKPRAILYPIFGERIFNKSIIGSTADIVSIIAVAAGTMGPIGFLGLQIGYGLHFLFDIPNTIATNMIIVGALILIAAISVASGVDKGIQFLSRLNVVFVVLLAAIILIIGPTMFLIDSFIGAQAFQLQHFFEMNLYRADHAWLGYWTVFFWGWFLGYAPMVAIFISKISRGRTIRELIIAVSIIAPLVSNFWFTVVGGTGLSHELNNPGSISGPLGDGGMPATVMAVMDQLPMGLWLAIGFLLVSIVFVSTTVDSISYTVAVTLQGTDHPQKWMRVFWVVLFGLLSVVLLSIGEGSIQALQNFIVVTAVPVSILLLPPLWSAPKIVKQMAIEQNLVPSIESTKEAKVKVAK